MASAGRHAVLLGIVALVSLAYSACTRSPSQNGRPTTSGEGILGYVARPGRILLDMSGGLISVKGTAGAISSPPAGADPYLVTLFTLGATDLAQVAASTATTIQLSESASAVGSASALADGSFQIDVPIFSAVGSSVAIVVSSAPIVDRVVPLAGPNGSGPTVAARRIDGPTGFEEVTNGGEAPRYRAHVESCSPYGAVIASDVRFGLPFVDYYTCVQPPSVPGRIIVACGELRVKTVPFDEPCGNMTGTFLEGDQEVISYSFTGVSGYLGERVCMEQRLTLRVLDGGTEIEVINIDQISPPIESCRCDSNAECDGDSLGEE